MMVSVPLPVQAATTFLRTLYGNESVTYLGRVSTYFSTMVTEVPVFGLTIGRISEHRQ